MNINALSYHDGSCAILQPTVRGFIHRMHGVVCAHFFSSSPFRHDECDSSEYKNYESVGFHSHEAVGWILYL